MLQQQFSLWKRSAAGTNVCPCNMFEFVRHVVVSHHVSSCCSVHCSGKLSLQKHILMPQSASCEHSCNVTNYLCFTTEVFKKHCYPFNNVLLFPLPTQYKRVENTTGSGVFLTKFEVFG